MTGHILAFMMLLGNVFQILASTALALPAVLALTLAVGRRSHGRLCLWGGAKLARLSLAVTLAGCVYYWFYYSLVFGIEPGPPAELAGAMRNNLYLAVGCWAAGLACVYLGYKKAASFPVLDERTPLEESRYALARVLPTLIPGLVACVCFTVAFFSMEGVFGTPPQGMDQTTYLVTLLRKTLHSAFGDLSLAGGAGVALVCMLRDRKELAEPSHLEKAARWCALWGVIGFLPGCIDQWSNLILSGIYLNGPTPGVVGVLRSPLFFRTLFMLCWLLVFCRPSLARSLGFCMLPWLLVMIVAPLTGVMM